MKFRGLDPRTQAVRWGLYAVAIGIVVGATGPPTAVAGAGDRVGGEPGEPAVDLRAALRLPGLRRGRRLGDLWPAALDEAPRRDRAPPDHLQPSTRTWRRSASRLAAIHGMLLALDSSVPFSLAQIAVPGLAPYAPVWVATFGQVGFYLMAAVLASFYVRRRIGQRAWRPLHYVTFLAFAGATAHGLVAGTDSRPRGRGGSTSGSSVVVAFLLSYRIAISVVGRSPGPARTAGPIRSVRPDGPL